MHIERDNEFLPWDQGMDRAYEQVNRDYAGLGDSYSEILELADEELVRVVGDYFSVGVAYLATWGHDEFTRLLGLSAWEAIERGMVCPLFTTDVRMAAVYMGAPAELIERLATRRDEMHVLFKASVSGREVNESAFVFVPPGLVVGAKRTPVLSLAAMSFVCSQVRDFANGRLYVDQGRINMRAYASEAHFLVEALKRHPGLELKHYHKELLRKFPEGANSTSLPRDLWYRERNLAVNPALN